MLTRQITAEQINRERPEKPGRGLTRQASIRQIDQEARTVELAFSSEAPVERFFGVEVLSHERSAVRMDRLSDGAAVLVNHDLDDQVGTVDAASIDDDRRGRATVRFGRSQRAEEIFQDIVDGIRRQVSVGYVVHKIEVETREGEPDLITVTDWEPHEVSVVSVAADISVGVGRGRDNGNPPEARGGGDADTADMTNGGAPAAGPQARSMTMQTKNVRDEAGNLVRAKVDDNGQITEIVETLEEAGQAERDLQARGEKREQERVRVIAEMGKQYRRPDLANEHIGNGSTPEQFQRALLDAMSQGGALDGRNDIGMTEKEVRQFSLARLLRAQAPGATRQEIEEAAFEREVTETAAREKGSRKSDFTIPTDILRSWGQRDASANAMETGTGASGGHLVSTQHLGGSFIDGLVNRMAIMNAGVTMLAGLSGDVDIPKETSGATAYWVPETGAGSGVPESTPNVTTLSLKPHTIAAAVPYTRRMRLQSDPSVEGFVRNIIQRDLALRMDEAFLTGVSDPDAPSGIADYVSAINWDSASTYTRDEVIDLVSAIEEANADLDGIRLICNAKTYNEMRKIKVDVGSGRFLAEDGEIDSRPVIRTNQAADSQLYAGVFSQAIVAMWSGLDLRFDPMTYAASDGHVVRVFQDVDMRLRHTESFALIENA